MSTSIEGAASMGASFLPAGAGKQAALSLSFPAGGGEMGSLIRAKDWSQTPLGPIERWSPSLRAMVSFLLANRFPLLLWWGPEYISIYNDSYRPVLGTKHPWALGTPVRDCWSEIWDVLAPLIDTPFKGGAPTWMEDLALEINRHGFVEETHFIVAYSPVPDETAPRGIGGVLATVHEITEKVVGERRMAALRDLGARTGAARTAEEACAVAAAALAGHAKDVPFALLYLLDQTGRTAQLAGTVGIEPCDAIAPAAINLDPSSAHDAVWPLAEALHNNSMAMVSLAGRRLKFPQGPWSDPPHSAVVAPIRSNMAHQLAGFLVAGTSSRLRLDDQYHSFLELAAAQIATAIATARAYEEERKRAEALAEIDRAKTLFFSNVSHEFRTPLTLMLGPLEEALSNAALPKAEHERLEAAHRNALRLLKLVNSLLDFSRIEAGRAQAVYEPVELATVTSELASNFRSACERAGLKLVVDCPLLPEPVYVDREMWEKIVLNLLSNAFKFTFDGEIAIRLRAVDGHVELTVSDTGVGIAKHELPRLFERFHRIEGQKSRTYEGSGIGLALVQELVKLHGGVISADSEVDRGTVFKISVPFDTARLPQDRIGAQRSVGSTSVRAEAYIQEALRSLPDGEPDAEALPESESSGPTSLLGGARVLLADDNADMRTYVQRLLARDCQVETVTDGQAALEAIRAHRPDLVLADVMMPRLDGFGLLRAIRADPALRDLPVIMLSARAGEESRVEGLQAGADDYLTKPFSARELIARVSAKLELSRVRQEATAALRDSERRLRETINALPAAIYTTDAKGMITHFNSACVQLSGRRPIIGSDHWCVTWKLYYPDGRPMPHDECPMAVSFREGRAVRGYEAIAERPDGTRVWFEPYPTPLWDAEGNLVGGINMLVDITHRKQAQERQMLLLREMNHRVKNLFMVASSLVTQSARHAPTAQDLAKVVRDRLAALARAHELVRPAFTDTGIAPSQAMTLDALMRSLFAAYASAGRRRIVTDGPAVSVGANSAAALALVLHELGTNAMKYGALSVEDGSVEIRWRNDGETIRIDWIEQDGPPIDTPPKEEGFGSKLARMSITGQLGGDFSRDWQPSGLFVRLAIPRERLAR